MPKRFEIQVAKMRMLQIEYSRNRSPLTLSAAKKAEDEVDSLLAKLFPVCKTAIKCDNHPKLFP